MPNFDGTGPQGKGPQTGRKLGQCNKTSDTPQTRDSDRGIGRENGKRIGSGRGIGRGRTRP